MRRRGALGLLGLLAIGCDGGAPAATSSASGSAPPAAAPPPPDDAIGFLTVRDPAALFAALRAAPSAPFVFGAGGWGAAAVDLLGLPITCAELVDERGSLRALALSGEGVIAVPLRDADRLIVFAAGGEGAPFRRARDAALGLDWLEPTRRGAGDPGAAALPLAVARNRLLWGTSRAALARAAAFVSHPDALVLGELERGPDAIALRGAPAATAALATRLAAAFGASPLFAALAQLVGPSAPDALGGFDASAEVAGGALIVRARVGGAAARLAELELGPVAPLWRTDASATLALALHQRADAREAAARAVGIDALASLAAEDREALAAALVALSRARASGAVLALERGPLGHLAWGTVELADADAARAALASLPKRFAPSDAAPDAPIRVEATVIERVGDVLRVRVGPSASHLQFLARQEGPRLLLATGADPVAALSRARRGGGAALGEIVPAPLRGAAGEEAALALVVDLPRALAAGPRDTPPRWAVLAARPDGDALALCLGVELDALPLVLGLLRGGPP